MPRKNDSQGSETWFSGFSQLVAARPLTWQVAVEFHVGLAANI